MFLELHMIQSFSPSNLNRDDTGQPKDCEFGGVRRARISSQCIKRSIRTAPEFAATIRVPVAKRTKWLVSLLKERLVQAGKSEEEADAVLVKFVPALTSKLDSGEEEKTAVLLYLAESEIESIAGALLEKWDELADEKGIKALAKTLVRAHKGHTSAPDIALFGRMLAEKPELGLDAACQVAHAISTHRVTMEMDFFTAVDDLNPEETAGAGMMGFTGFNSACFYRYARIDWGQLVANLKGDAGLAALTVEGFLRAAAAAVPTGKQTGFAANNPPSFMMAVVRADGMGWSLANAFEMPVRAQAGGGLVAPSTAALDEYWGQLCDTYGAGTLRKVGVLGVNGDPKLERLEPHRSGDLDTWVGEAVAALEEGAA